MTFKIITDYSEFLNLKEEWNNLLKKMDNPQIFYRFEWADCYMNYYDTTVKDRLCIIIGYQNESANIILPFTLFNGTLNFITSESTDYNNCYVDKNFNRYVLIDKAIRFLLENCEVRKCCFTNVPSCSELYILLDVLRKNDLTAYLEESVIVPFFSPNRNSAIQKKQIKDIERRKNRLEEKTKLKFITENTISEQQLQFLIETRGKKYKDSLLDKQNIVEFYKRLAIEIKENISINTLYVNDKIAAIHYGFADGKKIYYYIPSYDEQYAVNGVGLILLKSMIDDSNLKEVDFLKGNEPYKFYWCDDVNMNFHLLAYAKGKEQNLAKFLIRLKNIKLLRKIFGR